jgi:manganese efflux pump family protein
MPVHETHHARSARDRAAAIRQDGRVRRTTVAAAGTALVASLLLPGCAATAARSATPPAHGTTESCYDFAVSALRRHVVVRRRPAACAGLSQAQVNQDVARALRTVIGSHPKAVERRLAAANSRYLGSLVKPVAPPPPESLASSNSTRSGQLGIRLGALAAWLTAAVAGAYLLAPWLTRDRRQRAVRKPGASSLVPLGHAGCAIAGLCIWIAFTVTGVDDLAWTAVGLTFVIAGLGMATLLTASPEQQPGAMEATASGGLAGMSTTPFQTRAPVVVIALHGVLATLTILLVLLAAVGVG